MSRNVIALAIASLAVVSFSGAASAAPGKYRFSIYNQNGKEIYDDGKLDGKACVVGKKAVYNPITGKFVVKPAVKCNF
ncbi:hypothetical protein [Prosthecodimorpha staleyi]|uniref:Uncharacterized protein n=1 Tax=Prosthecodimorpha staleyi TaxID=2840188 RepID=A0A947GDP2_9HYPH|nr:hypothetical protein [Prosthecodimorpha staleyi]MBT9290511.1 hypothetical protein [Prosthecodimorpha staleyi]